MGRVRYPSVQYNGHHQVDTHGTHRPRRIQLHDTESGDRPGVSDISGVGAFWKAQNRGFGAHAVIDADGNLGRFAWAKEICWATFMHNTGSLHIELIGFASLKRWQWLKRKRQLDKAAKLCAYWCKRFGINPHHERNNGIGMHREFPESGHTDPGAGFPIDDFCKRVRGYLANGW